MAGTFYWIVYPASGTDPANTQVGADYIIAGQDGAGTTATGSGSVSDTGQTSPVDAATEVSVTPGTAYKVAWAWKDGTTYATAPYVVIGSFTHASIAATGALATASAGTVDASGSTSVNASITLTGAVAAGAAAAPTGTGAAAVALPGSSSAAAAQILAATGAGQILLPGALAAASASSPSASASSFLVLSSPAASSITQTSVTLQVNVTV